MFEAKVAMITRPGALLMIPLNAWPTTCSLGVYPGASARVLSDTSASTPCAPNLASMAKSAVFPSAGVWSNLKSPVWITVPTGEWIA